jgi:hypothetical protein
MKCARREEGRWVQTEDVLLMRLNTFLRVLHRSLLRDKQTQSSVLTTKVESFRLAEASTGKFKGN